MERWLAALPLCPFPQLWRSESFPLEARLSVARSSPRIERRSFAAQEHTRDRQPTVHTSSLFAHTEQCIFCPESCPWLPCSLFRNAYQSHTPATAPWNCFCRFARPRKHSTTLLQALSSP